MGSPKNLRAAGRLAKTRRSSENEQRANADHEPHQNLDKNKTPCSENTAFSGQKLDGISDSVTSDCSENDRTIPLAIVDKSALFRTGLVSILAGSRFSIAASCAGIEQFTKLALKERPAVAIVTLDNEAEMILAQISEFVEQGIRFLVLSERFQSSEVFAAIEAGVNGYLLKGEINPEALLTTLELICLQGLVLPHDLGKLIKNSGAPKLAVHKPIGDQPRFSPACETSDELAQLSNRERTILLHLTQGASNKQIARQLNIAEATVKVYVKSLLRKIRAENRTQAAIWAMGKLSKTTLGLFVLACAVIFSLARIPH